MNKLLFLICLSNVMGLCLLSQDLSLKLNCTGLSVIECGKENCSFEEYFPTLIIIGQEGVRATISGKIYSGNITDSNSGIKISFINTHILTLNFTFENWSHLVINGNTQGEFQDYLLDTKKMNGKILARFNTLCQTY